MSQNQISSYGRDVSGVREHTAWDSYTDVKIACHKYLMRKDVTYQRASQFAADQHKRKAEHKALLVNRIKAQTA